MKTLTLNKRHILYGMLVMSLGLTKAWLQTAESESGSRSLAETSPTGPATRPQQQAPAHKFEVTYPASVAGCDNKKAQIELVSETSGPRKEWNGSAWIISDEPQVRMFARYTFECKTLNTTLTGKVEITNASTITSARGLEEASHPLVKVDIEDQAKEIRKAKEDEEAVANCEQTAEGKDLLDGKYTKERYSCLSQKVRNISDRKERREAFQTDIVDQLQKELLESTSDEERREIMKAIAQVGRTFGHDAAVSLDMKYLKLGANSFMTILQKANDSALNPRNALSNSIAIDNSIAFFKRPVLDQYGRQIVDPITHEPIVNRAGLDWYSTLSPAAALAESNPNAIIQQYFSDVFSGTDNGGIDTGIDTGIDSGFRRNDGEMDSRGSRVDMGGMRYIPKYLNTNSNRDAYNQGGMYPSNRGGMTNGPRRGYVPPGGSGYSGGGYRQGSNMTPRQQQQQQQRMYDPRTGRPVSGFGGNGGSQYAPQYGNIYGQQATSGRAGGIPQMGRRF